MRLAAYAPPGRSRRWLGPIAALVLSATLGFLPLSIKRPVAGVLERTVFFPFRFTVGWGERMLSGREEAKRLSRELAQRQWSRDEAEEARIENARLRRLLGFHRRADHNLVPCSIVGREWGRAGEVLLIEAADPGAAEPGRAVVSPDGLIGRVSSREGRYARVECLTHIQVAVSVLNQRSREGGILKWSPERRPGLAIRGIPSQSDWQPGDRLVTSGLGTAFPRGILVGWVERHRSQGGGMLKEVRVRPAARAARAEEVFLLERVEAGFGFPGAEEPGEDLSALFPVEPGARSARTLFKGKVGVDPGPMPVP